MRILFAEDHEDLRKLFTSYLEEHGHAVTPAADGQELLDRLYTASPGSFDAIVTDNNMPAMTGIEALRFIKGGEEYKNLPVIVFSLTNDVKFIEFVKKLGGIFVDKADNDQLLSTLEKVEESITV